MQASPQHQIINVQPVHPHVNWLGTLSWPFPGLGSTMDPQAYHSPTYTYTHNNPYSATSHNNHLPFTFTCQHKQHKQYKPTHQRHCFKNCNHISYHSLSNIETPGVRPLPRVYSILKTLSWSNIEKVCTLLRCVPCRPYSYSSDRSSWK